MVGFDNWNPEPIIWELVSTQEHILYKHHLVQSFYIIAIQWNWYGITQLDIHMNQASK